MTDIILTLNTGGEQGLQGAQGDRGEQGVRGPQGLRGPIGPIGERGPQGQGLSILGSFPAEANLPTSSQIGDAYLIGVNLYVSNGTAFVNMGPVRGPQGEQGIQGLTGPQGPEWMNWRDEWMPATSYEIGDGVFYLDEGQSGRVLRATADHISPASFSLTNWQVVYEAPAGPVGPQGIQGPVGPQGIQGNQGIQGVQGPVGASGTMRESWRGTLTSGMTIAVGDVGTTTWTQGGETSYAVLVANTAHTTTAGNLPTQANYSTRWDLMAVLTDGTDGRDGVDGVSINTVIFTNEVEFEDYIPGINELVVLVNA